MKNSNHEIWRECPHCGEVWDARAHGQQKRANIKQYVKEWMEGHEPDTFVKNKDGNVIYSAGHSSLNLVAFFENLLEDYIDDSGL